MTFPPEFAALPEPERIRIRTAMRAATELAFRYACPIVLGPSQDRSAPFNTATGIVARRGGSFFYVTADHVLAAYEAKKQLQSDLVGYLSAPSLPEHFDPIQRALLRDSTADIAVLRLTQAEAAATGTVAYDRLPAEPQALSPPVAGEHVFVAGFPGVLRTMPGVRHLEFNSFVVGTTITSVVHDRFNCRLERDQWISDRENAPGLDLTELGGLSGGPVLRTTGIAFDLLGVVSQYDAPLDYVACARLDSVPTSVWNGA